MHTYIYIYTYIYIHIYIYLYVHTTIFKLFVVKKNTRLKNHDKNQVTNPFFH